jgi:mRNA interferase RelE/StbE
MTRYVVIVAPAVEKILDRMRDRKLSARLWEAIAALADDPRPPRVKKMVGREADWRIRVSDWRIIYRIDDGRLVVLVVEAGGRKEVYR